MPLAYPSQRVAYPYFGDRASSFRASGDRRNLEKRTKEMKVPR
jgi:hypothetical protein